MAFLGISTKRDMEAMEVRHRADLDAAINAATEAALKQAAAEFPQWLLSTANSEKYNLPDPSIYGNQADLYRKLSSVLRACENTGKAAAVVDFSVLRIVRDREPKDIANHPFEMLLKHPNPLDSRFDFINATTAMYLLTGNFYWWLNAASENDTPEEMWLIPSHMIQPIPDRNMFIRGYYYYPGDGQEMILPPWEILHCKRFNPFSRFVGLSAVEAIAVEAVGLLKMQEWNTQYFGKNNARLPSILTFADQIPDTTWLQMKDDIRDASKKREMLLLRSVGQGGVNWLQNAISQKDMEFLQGLNVIDKDIMDTLAPGLHTWLSGDSTYSNANANRAAFNELTLYPILTMISEKITSSILPRYGGRELLGRFEDVRINDKQLELAEQQQYAISHTIGEIREKYYGDDPLGDERDELLPAQVNTSSGGIQEPPKPPTPPQSQNPPAPDNAEQPDQEEQAEEDAQAAKLMIFEQLNKWKRFSLKAEGRYLQFDTSFLPASVVQFVYQQMPSTKSAAAVETVFEQARDMVRGRSAEIAGPMDAAKVLEGIRLAIEAKRIDVAA
jgi:phage portal protein BeeE